MENQTLGEKRVNLHFAPLTDAQKEAGAQFKADVAALIDRLEADKGNKNLDGEKAREYANAMTYLEIGCMLAVKAIYN